MVSLRSQLVALAAALAIPAVSGQDLEDFIAKQRPLSLTNVLNNLGAAAGAAPGLVIASPSRTDPPCKSEPWMAMFGGFVADGSATRLLHLDP